jgi:hypothetical protein
MEFDMRRVFLLAGGLWLVSCGGENVSESKSGGAAADGGDAFNHAVAPSEWDRLATSRIYFGHQSVGRNIVDGLRELEASGASRPLTVLSARPPVAFNAAALVEFSIGENGRPYSKMADFAAALDEIGDTAGAIAMFKYCYLDFTADTDVDELFARHRDAVKAMRARHPDLMFVHVTTPLTTLETGPRYVVKRLLRKPTTRDANAKRNMFNAMLLTEYAGEPILDLARVESTLADGSRSFFTSGSDTVYTLAAELTDDGGHLNVAGRRAAAAALTAVVARARGAVASATPGAPR